MINCGWGKTYFPAATRIIHHSIATSIIHLAIRTSILLKQGLCIWLLQHELPMIWCLSLKPLNINCSGKSTKMSIYIFGYWIKVGNVSITEIETDRITVYGTLYVQYRDISAIFLLINETQFWVFCFCPWIVSIFLNCDKIYV